MFNLVEVTNNPFINLIQEELGFSLDEAVRMSSELEKFFDKTGLKPDFKTVDVRSIEPAKNKKLVKVKTGKRESEMKITKFLRKIFPDLSGPELDSYSKMFKKYLYRNIEFKIQRNPSKYYNSKYRPGSCMNNTDIVKFYDNLGDVYMLVMYEEGRPVGSALFWSKVDGINVPYIDRIYPAGDRSIWMAFHDYARENGYCYRNTWGYDDYDTVTDGKKYLSVFYTFNVDNVIDNTVPYMDTFRFGTFIDDGDDIVRMSNKSGDMEFDNQFGFYLEDEEGNDPFTDDNIYLYDEFYDDDERDINCDSLRSSYEVDLPNYNIKADIINTRGDVNVGNLDIRDFIYCNNLKCENVFFALSIKVDDIDSRGSINAKSIKVENDIYAEEDVSGKNVSAKNIDCERLTVKDELVCININVDEFSFEEDTSIEVDYNITAKYSFGTWKGKEGDQFVDMSWDGIFIGKIYDPDREGNYEEDWEWEDDYVIIEEEYNTNPKEYFS